ncbi:MAG: EF-hand domain-containing protein [Candidatus Thiodiazotropha sp. (ex Dulcina madagascariensis)]|nr:EF-hand domain-containing protein [Candidatus Thiodiazotropha sp. (ex Epidulcina cf. delphinae)]MCU7921202.1 EF-hand domain-containing protein [Candidatus Thiodiazotropha sp. (ex Dulcina madagascariensis)]MCU7925749.1 EF-hand domain-containing protein [Candidatus Thiodiazotropha sp. (ex Dulcina madagascariensis)]MCU7936227.1 EF-hand domain-containing protein [Candidatus Thiodiazotropha sp. (ex Dulcina madagascariensis)]
MKTITMKRTLVALAAAGFVTVAMAGEEAFKKLDANADGYISAEESTADERLYQGWATADTNDDGMIDAAEFSAFEVNNTKSE